MCHRCTAEKSRVHTLTARCNAYKSLNKEAYFSHGAATIAASLVNSSRLVPASRVRRLPTRQPERQGRSHLTVNTQHTTTKVPFMVQSGRYAVRSSRPSSISSPVLPPTGPNCWVRRFRRGASHCWFPSPTNDRAQPTHCNFGYRIRAHDELKMADMSRI